MAVKDWSTTASSNTSVGGVSIAEGMSRASVNNAIRGLMAEAKAKFNEIISVKDYGAAGDWNGSTGTDDTTAIQAAVTAAVAAGGCIHFPKGRYRITSTIQLSEPVQQAIGTATRVSLSGDGAGASVLQWDGASDVPMIEILGEVISFQSIEKLGLQGSGTTSGTGIKADGLAWFWMDRVVISNFKQAMDLTDVLSTNFNALIVRVNKNGILMQRGDLSYPNAINFYGCDIGLNEEYGIDIRGAGTVNFYGGAIQGNGIGGAGTDRTGVRLINSGPEGVVGANFYGVYFETNAGDSDVTIDQASNDSVINFWGCTFQRIDSTNYVTNNIYVANGTLNLRLGVYGCGFKHAGTYTPDSGRKYISVVTPAETGFHFDGFGNFYSSSTEKPDFAFPGATEDAMASAWARYNGTADTLGASYNIASVTKNGTGDYTFTYRRAMSVDANCYTVSLGTGVGLAHISAETATTVRVLTKNISDVATDFSVVCLHVFGGANRV